MLKGIDLLLGPALLHVLAAMGHGDEIVVADANFTAAMLARGQPLVALPGAGVQRAAQAVLSPLPLDAAVAQPVAYMLVGDMPAGDRGALQRSVLDSPAAHDWASPAQRDRVERSTFHGRARAAFAAVHTGELQPFANFIFKKGAIADALAA